MTTPTTQKQPEPVSTGYQAKGAAHPSTGTIHIEVDDRMVVRMIVEAFMTEFWIPKKLEPALEALARRLAREIGQSHFDAFNLHREPTRGNC